MINVDISPLLVVSQELMPDVYVLSVAVFNRIMCQADCTHYHIGVELCSDCSQSPGGFASSKAVVRNTVVRQHIRPQWWIGQRMFVS
jgi:hypothetical protein